MADAIFYWTFFVAFIALIVWIALAYSRRSAIEILTSWSRSFGKLILYASLLLLVVILVVLGALYLFSPVHYYVMVYGVIADNVVIQDRPHDCDWGKAPIGSKECHFEKTVTVLKNDKGAPIQVMVEWVKVPE